MKNQDLYSYRVTWSDEDQEYVGLCAEFPSLSFLDATQEKAFSGIRHLVQEVVSDMQQNQEKIPDPIATQHFSGKFMLRIPPDIHRKLTLEAHEAQISLNRYVSAKLASGPTVKIVYAEIMSAKKPGIGLRTLKPPADMQFSGDVMDILMKERNRR